MCEFVVVVDVFCGCYMVVEWVLCVLFVCDLLFDED